MKKAVALLLVVSMLLLSSLSAFAVTTGMREGSKAIFDDYFEDYNVTRMTPWLKQYNMERQDDYDAGRYGGEGSQQVMVLAVSPVNSDNVILGSDKASGWISHNGGALWRMMDVGMTTWAVVDAKWHPSEENTAYIVQVTRGDFGEKQSTLTDGLYKTTDCGKTWQQVNTLNYVSVANYTENLIYFDQNENVYTLAADGVYKSTDEGANWTCLGKLCKDSNGTYKYAAPNATNVTFDVQQAANCMYVSPNGNTIMVCAKGGFYVTRDGGKTWTTTCETTGGADCTSVAVDPTNSNHWVVVYPKTHGTSKVYTTTNNGFSWKEIAIAPNNNKTNTPAYVKFGPAKADGKPTLYMVFSAMNDPYRYCLDGTKTEFSSTIGVDWKTDTRNSDFIESYIPSAGYSCEGLGLCDTDPNIVYFSFGDVVQKSVDGGITFQNSNQGYSGISIQQFYFDKDNTIWLCATDRSLSVTNTPYDGVDLPTNTLTSLPQGSCESCVVDPNNPNHMFASTAGRLYESMDRAKTWTQKTDNGSYTFIRYLSDGKTIVTPNYTSKDNGATWTANARQIRAISPVDEKVWLSLPQSKKYSVSFDGGQTWSAERTSPANSTIYTFYPDLFDADICWMGTYGGHVAKVKLSTGAVTLGDLTLSGQNFETVSVLNFAQDPNDKNHLVAGGKATQTGTNSYGIVETYNGGANWYNVPGFRGPMDVTSLQFSPVSNEVFIGTTSNGILIYEFDKYNRTKSTISFDLNGIEADPVAPVTGIVANTVTLPDVTNVTNGTIKDFKWVYEDTIKDMHGNVVTSWREEYAPGEKFKVDNMNVTLKADYDMDYLGFTAKNAQGKVELLDSLKATKVTATSKVNANGYVTPIFAIYETQNPAKLLKFEVMDKVLVSGEQNVSSEIDLTNETVTGKTLKFFIFETLTNLKPLTSVISVN